MGERKGAPKEGSLSHWLSLAIMGELMHSKVIYPPLDGNITVFCLIPEAAVRTHALLMLESYFADG
jgi:hypothetical protein